MTESIFITGAGGQDAYFISKHLKRRTEYKTIGLSNKDVNNLNNTNYFDEVTNIPLENFDEVEKFICTNKPKFIFNFGAIAGSLTQFDDPQKLINVNSLSVLNILETIRKNRLQIKLIQASSSEIFANNDQVKQSLDSPRKSRTIYGTSKIFSDSLIEVYRSHFNLDCFSAILFSHESPLRKDIFFTKKLVNQIFDYLDNKIPKIVVYSPNALRDWGYAGDYCSYIVEKALSDNHSDLIIGSGKAHTVREFVEVALSYFNLNYEEVVEEVKSPKTRASEKKYIFMNPVNIDSNLACNSKYDFKRLIKLLIRYKKYNRQKRGIY